MSLFSLFQMWKLFSYSSRTYFAFMLLSIILSDFIDKLLLLHCTCTEWCSCSKCALTALWLWLSSKHGACAHTWARGWDLLYLLIVVLYNNLLVLWFPGYLSQGRISQWPIKFHLVLSFEFVCLSGYRISLIFNNNYWWWFPFWKSCDFQGSWPTVLETLM